MAYAVFQREELIVAQANSFDEIMDKISVEVRLLQRGDLKARLALGKGTLKVRDTDADDIVAEFRLVVQFEDVALEPDDEEKPTKP